jgi:hypothetical protein
MFLKQKQKMTETANHCHENEVRHAEMEYIIICDYAQNMPLPHYGDEQLGEIYFFSALKSICLELSTRAGIRTS